MPQTQITQRIGQFERVVASHAKEISEIGNASWKPIKESTETPTIRAYLTKKDAGVDYLNTHLTPLLSKNGRVVKFAGLFLHGTPMVRGWTMNQAGKKQHSRSCELADLMTVFLYLDKGKTIKRMRCVMFQAKMLASKGAHVVEDLEQRKLYDECDGFDYINGSVSSKGESRTFPKGAPRKKALQFMFVEPRPVETRTIPSDEGKGRTLNYGDHLVRVLNGKTGLRAATRKSGWGKIVWELMEKMTSRLYSDNKIKGPGIQDVLNHFNSFENHDIWRIDEGSSDNGFGVQIMIIWDGSIPDESISLPISPEPELEASLDALEKPAPLGVITLEEVPDNAATPPVQMSKAKPRSSEEEEELEILALQELQIVEIQQIE